MLRFTLLTIALAIIACHAQEPSEATTLKSEDNSSAVSHNESIPVETSAATTKTTPNEIQADEAEITTTPETKGIVNETKESTATEQKPTTSSDDLIPTRVSTVKTSTMPPLVHSTATTTKKAENSTGHKSSSTFTTASIATTLLFTLIPVFLRYQSL